MIEFDISQIKELQDNLNKLQDDLRHKVCKQIAISAGEDLQNKASNKTPADTGELRRNWNIRQEKLPDGYKVTVFNPIEYAEPVEYGHRVVIKRNKKKKRKNNPPENDKKRKRSSGDGHTRFVKGRFMLTKSKEEVASTIAARGEQFINKAIKEKLNAK